MNEPHILTDDTLAATLDELCINFGVWKIARALLFAASRRRHAKNQIVGMSNRMRRDIGLPEQDNVLLEARYSIWDIPRP